MRKVFHVAAREFIATVTARGFLFGILLTPAIVLFMVFLLPRFTTKSPPRVDGVVAVIDRSGEAGAELAHYLSPAAIRERRLEERRRLREFAASEIGSGVTAGAILGAAPEEPLGEVPHITVVTLAPDADPEREKERLKLSLAPRPADGVLLAVALVPAGAVVRDGDGFDDYHLFVRSGLDDRLVDELQAGLEGCIRGARLRGSGIAPELVAELVRVERPPARVVTAEGERKASPLMNQMLPIAFMVLLMISVITSSSSLLTTTIEEKSNRIVELLLSALSSRELMTGKILGQMAVGLLILLLYTGMGLGALASFTLTGLVDPVILLFLLVFFVLSYFTVAALMAAVGSAVSEMRDAQPLMMPVMMVFMVPWLLMVPIGSHPNSLMAVVLSFVPPIGSFVTLLRMASGTPPPLWQVVLAVAAGAAGATASLWFAAKVFRVGVLMYGKPPTLRTLIRWARIPD